MCRGYRNKFGMTTLKILYTKEVKIIGHRGAKGLAPENTLAAIKKALQHHVDEIEIDVRVTKDGVAILLHDPVLVDAAGNTLELTQHSYEELLEHKPDLCTLDEAIQLVNKRVPLLIEIKPKVDPKSIIALIELYQSAELSVASFDMQILLDLHKALPTVPLVVNDDWSGVRAAWRARKLGTKRLNMYALWLWPGFLRSMKRRGYQIAPYTVNTAKLAKQWQPYIYGVITDFPDLFEK